MPSRKPSTTSSTASDAARREAARFRVIFDRIHADHGVCRTDEWLHEPCTTRTGSVLARPVIWSRRNGPWRRVSVLWVGAAPGNAGGRGSGARGAHATRIPFGGDIAGANLDVLLAALGLDRNRTFIVAALNQLPARGVGEPTSAELTAPIGDFASSVHVLRDTLLAAGPRLVVALGNVALRVTIAAARLTAERAGPPRLPGLARLASAGVRRGASSEWPAAFPPDAQFRAAWRDAWPDAPWPRILPVYHPSAQNMSPFAARGTRFHRRMVATRAALQSAAAVCGDERAAPVAASDDIHALPEWRAVIEPYHARLAALWRARGVG